MYAVNAASYLPALRSMALVVGIDWELQLVKALRSTPNLVTLDVVCQGGYGANEVEPMTEPPLHLPELREFCLDSTKWAAGMSVISAAAPQLRSISLSAVDEDSMEADADQARQVLSKPTLRVVQVFLEPTSAWLIAQTRREGSKMLKDVRILTLRSGVRQ